MKGTSSNFKTPAFFAVALVILGFIAWGFLRSQKSGAHPGQIRTSKLFQVTNFFPERTSPEPVLIIPYSEKSAFLIQKDGTILKEWASCCRIAGGQLDQKGNLVLLTKDPEAPQARVYNYIQVLDKDSKVLWTHRDNNLHHDVEPLADGNILAIKYRDLSASGKKKLSGALKGIKRKPVCDEIVEIDRNQNAVWTLNVEDLLENLPRDAFNFTRNDEIPGLDYLSVCHTNLVREYVKNSFSQNPVLLISVRNISRVFLVDKATRKVLWKSPDGALLRQHDPRLYGDEVIVFNNNSVDSHRKDKPSEVVVFNLKTQTKRVVYGQQTYLYQMWGSPLMSGAEMLSNGNLLITVADNGEIFEVNNKGDLAFRAHVFSPTLHFEMGNTINRTNSYSPDFLKSVGLMK